jgi:hypothetical protein
MTEEIELFDPANVPSLVEIGKILSVEFFDVFGAGGGGGTGSGIVDYGITQLINGQSYIDVVFGTAQPNNNWILVECNVVNTVDASPLNIWSGIVTIKLTTGFRLQLNGAPDSNNYFLHWAIAAGSASVATTYALSGPSSGTVGVPSTNFTVQLPTGSTVIGIVTVTPSDGGAGGTFTPTSVGLTTAAPSATFTYTPVSAGAKTISVTNDGGLTNPANLTYTAVAVGLSDGDTIDTWPDSSGNGNNALKVGTPIFKTNIVNGKPVVRFITANSAGFNLTTIVSGLQPWCMFVVMKQPTSADTIASLVGNGAPGLPLGPYLANTGYVFVASRQGYQQAVNPSNAFHVLTADCRSNDLLTGLEIHIDGTWTTSPASTASVNTGDFAYLGYVGVGTPGFGNGDIAEILLVKPAAPIYTVLRANIEATLGAKYGITVTSGGTVIDLTTVPGMAGWWKADSLL